MNQIYPCTLSKAEKEVYRMFTEDDMSHDEIAKARGGSPQTSKNLLSRARKKIEKCKETLENV
jgi:DNA-directed RNA polymerase specialized sigma24 family protein